MSVYRSSKSYLVSIALLAVSSPFLTPAQAADFAGCLSAQLSSKIESASVSQAPSFTATLAEVATSKNAPKRVLLIQPLEADKLEFGGMPSSSEYAFLPNKPGKIANFKSNSLNYFSVRSWLEHMKNAYRDRKIDGIIGTHDFSASLLASVLGKELGLKVPDPEAMLRLTNKYLSRKLQQSIVPEAVPKFALVDPDHFNPQNPPLAYPFFIKPVRASVSAMAQVIRDDREFSKYMSQAASKRPLFQAINRPFDQLVKESKQEPITSKYFIAEEVMGGPQFTVDGFVQDGKATVLGVVDSLMTPGTNSFESFQYPSSLPEAVQTQMQQVARKVMEASGFDNSIFNIEMFYDPKSGKVSIIEINPRMARQFSDLYEKVRGFSLYEIQAKLATGQPVATHSTQGNYGAAASFVIRKFKNQAVRGEFDTQEIERIQKEDPDARIKLFQSGWLSLINPFQDVESERLALVNIGAEDREKLRVKYEKIRARLGIAFEDKK